MPNVPLVAVDFETVYRKKEYSVSDLGPDAYCRDSRFNAYLVSVYCPEKGIQWVGNPTQFNWHLLDGCQVWAHNASFDERVFRELVNRRLIANDLQLGDWLCSADLAAFCGSGRSLADATKAWFGVTLDKSVRDKMSGMTPEEAKAAGCWEAWRNYAMSDAVWCHRLASFLGPRWPAKARRMALRSRRRADYGVRVNKAALEDGIAILTDKLYDAEQQIPWEWEEDKTPLSAKKLAEECRKLGIPPPVSLAKDSEDCEIWLETYADQAEWIHAFRDWRRINAFLLKLLCMHKRLRTDDTMALYLKYFGAHTGRFSGDSGFNPQNLMRDTLFGVNIRNLLIPRPGCKFVIWDLSQIEPRVLNWLAGTPRGLKFLQLCAGGLSPYEAYARVALNWTGGVLKKENADMYKLAKAIVLGAGYGAGGPKFVVVAKTLAQYEISEANAIKEIAEFRRKNPHITGLWARLERDMIRSAKAMRGPGVYTVVLPSGREMKYWDIISSPSGWKVKDEYGGYHKQTWGGKLTENITQAAAYDVFGDKCLELDDTEVDFPLWTVHDEGINEVDEARVDHAKGIVNDVIHSGVPYMPEVPLDCEIIVADKYCK